MAKKQGNEKSTAPLPRKAFHLEWKNSAQKIAYMAFEQHDLLFLLGVAGTGKTHLAVAFACSEILSKKKKKIVLTRPIVEAGEKLGYLPGTFEEKINPFLMPIFDCLDMLVGRDTVEREKINHCLEIAPVAYLRGRTFNDSVVILDEAQNSTEEQLKLVMTRLGYGSKMVITGDPTQSDLRGEVALTKVVEGMKGVEGIGVVEFSESHIVRHPLVADILAAWPK
jgi:phosphate starvation-inducible PhoH-like protein